MSGNRISNATTILVECEVSSVVQAVFDFPVPANQLPQPGVVGFGWQQTGDAVGNLFALGSIGEDGLTLDGKDLSCVREVDLLGFNRPTDDAAALDAPVAFVMVSFLPGKKARMATSSELCSTAPVDSS